MIEKKRKRDKEEEMKRIGKQTKMDKKKKRNRQKGKRKYQTNKEVLKKIEKKKDINGNLNIEKKII